MIISGLDTRQAKAQLDQLFGVEHIFRRRGRTVTESERVDRLLFKVDAHGWNQDVFEAMRSTSFRRVVATVANSEATITSGELSKSHGLQIEKVVTKLQQAAHLGLILERDGAYVRSSPKTFGASLEWFVAATCMAELSSVAYWGVRVDGIDGDYDVVLSREGQIGYIECKSGRLGQLSGDDISRFLEREQALAPQFSIFLLDGVSRERVRALADAAVRFQQWYMFDTPTGMPSVTMITIEEYKNFVRIRPLNAFFVEAQRSIREAIREVYEFLTVVCDRHLVLENTAAKFRFRPNLVG